ncbi:CynX/NimT family MFS transporter [Periweissella fabalis]|uniref:MFS transporter n=1 Tax=Periweissella fabalis TaxID=1070421 RepID=A0A7X6N3X4_9LACO|nr:MFS transporter [Periweissella fabalis]MCM0599693.1 MFS transporter [Periweissella fabalis]NKZ24894.1 MFS transporter [Periweissella fabalis]
MQTTTKHSPFLLPGIILLGAVLRIPITSIPPVLSQIAHGLHIPVASLGVLTTLPLLAFAIFSPIAPIIARKFGIELTFIGVLLLMLVGSIIRIISTPFLFIGTLLVGIAIAQMNVLLPTLIAANFPNKIGAYTSIYTFTMGLMTALFSAIAVPIVLATNWQTLIILLSCLVIIALIIWFPNIRHNHLLAPKGLGTNSVPSAWKNITAWYLLIFMGLQSAIFYTSISWLPTIAVAHGISSNTAGLLAGINALISLPVSFLVPNIIAHANASKRRIFVISVSLFAIISFIMLIFANDSFIFWLILNLFNGLATGALFPYLMTSFGKKTNTPAETAELSGMAQAGGYLIAAVGPFLFGLGYSTFHTWTVQTIVLIVVTIIMMICALLVERKEKVFD